MFTGIVEEIGVVRAVARRKNLSRIAIQAKKVLPGTTLGSSIAVNGACMTAVERGRDFFSFDVMKESLDKTTLGQLRGGSRVNLERALAVGSRFGGHVVQGHVDGVGMILGIKKIPGRYDIKIKAPKDILKNIRNLLDI